MKYLKQVLGNDLRQIPMVLALLVLLVGFHIISGGRMLTSSNMQNLISGNAYVLILAIGMLMVIVIGQIDLSVGSVAGFVSMIVAISARNFNLPWFVAVLLGIAIGVLVGSWQGFWLSKMGIPGFISTLAGLLIFRGAVIWVSGSISVPAPKELQFFGAGYLPEWGPGWTGMNNSTLVLGLLAIAGFIWSQARKYTRVKDAAVAQRPALWPTVVRVVGGSAVIAYATWLFGSGRPGTSFPVPGLVLVVLFFIYYIVTVRTRFGRHIYAVGGNKQSAALSGVNVSRTYFAVMVNMSFLAALAGVLFLGRATAAGPSDGTNWEMDAISAVFIGGAAVSGGVGTIMATMVGGVLIAVLNSGLMLMGVGADKTQVIKGLVLLLAVAIDALNKQQGRPSIIGKIMESFQKKDK
ncbi:sugar ABC transporter permease [Bifidobacterium crudilactis]|jgi:putative multiple sugar transport system permease protein|uniref:Xylose transport system permease protein XylH n=1 Tax=Bifidobacterium crudilactis TaxID=327277 RepID=A0A971CZH2_9BIFI|nr:sugar ABC transporter permease [Bifidobacterium crudilactis]MCI1868300.1 sugar ABC transporter permease [Bifidobacterium crudilactis]MDN5972751.1 sugar ABC transporter permease [Bifidobacterium crudilactis]MDN6001014.1 sugar ABC transporter permease [Bifidobacterium crudilactis]MDN6466578.1 sugar ABC transporter permease [Bifidobacterium crudilactis]MDN6522855.1 sugar ABC transporter permease [Bifidobacterium crudilactis]